MDLNALLLYSSVLFFFFFGGGGGVYIYIYIYIYIYMYIHIHIILLYSLYYLKVEVFSNEMHVTLLLLE